MFFRIYVIDLYTYLSGEFEKLIYLLIYVNYLFLFKLHMWIKRTCTQVTTKASIFPLLKPILKTIIGYIQNQYLALPTFGVMCSGELNAETCCWMKKEEMYRAVSWPH